jgi:F420-0:gamma-glutamyl ligase-like protein
MLLRIRWFVVGALASLGVVGYLAARLRKARERLTPSNLARHSKRAVADLLDSAADTIRPHEERS